MKPKPNLIWSTEGIAAKKKKETKKLVTCQDILSCIIKVESTSRLAVVFSQTEFARMSSSKFYEFFDEILPKSILYSLTEITCQQKMEVSYGRSLWYQIFAYPYLLHISNTLKSQTQSTFT